MGKDLVDAEGRSYTRPSWGGDYSLKPGAHGRGIPERDLFGDRVRATRDGQYISSSDTNESLYRASQPNGGGGSDGGDAIAALVLGLGFLLFGAIFALYQKFPRAMIVIHLVVGVAGMAYFRFSVDSLYGIALAIFAVSWPWIWLTQRLPVVMWPINAAVVGAGLWALAGATRTEWQPLWLNASFGIPLIGNLQMALAVFPMLLLMWVAAARRWPMVMAVPTRIAIGAVVWFVLFRVAADGLPLWLPWWEYIFWPAPIIRSAPAIIIAIFPLALWIWWNGLRRVPLLFGAINMLALGMIAFLVVYHILPGWEEIWLLLIGNLPAAGFPTQSLVLIPLIVWLWSRVWRKWPRAIALPSLILAGAIGCYLLERTRPYWGEYWPTILGPLPLVLDPALLVFVVPAVFWVVRYILDRWPQLIGVARAVAIGGILWILVARTQLYWQSELRVLPTFLKAQLAFVAALLPIFAWFVFRAGRLAGRAMR